MGQGIIFNHGHVRVYLERSAAARLYKLEIYQVMVNMRETVCLDQQRVIIFEGMINHGPRI